MIEKFVVPILAAVLGAIVTVFLSRKPDKRVVLEFNRLWPKLSRALKQDLDISYQLADLARLASHEDSVNPFLNPQMLRIEAEFNYYHWEIVRRRDRKLARQIRAFLNASANLRHAVHEYYSPELAGHSEDTAGDITKSNLYSASRKLEDAILLLGAPIKYYDDMISAELASSK